MNEEMTSAAIPGTGAPAPEGKPANFGDAIVNPGAAKRWKAINKTHTGGILRKNARVSIGAHILKKMIAIRRLENGPERTKALLSLETKTLAK